MHSLEHAGYKLGKVPKHPLKAFTDIEAKAKVIEGQSVLGMAGAISVSWLIYYSLVQMKRFKQVLREYITLDDYDTLMERVDIEDVLETLRVSQDGILEEIELQAVVMD